MALKDVKQIIGEWYQLTIASEVKKVATYSYVKEITAAVVIVLVVAGGFWGYRSYQASKEASAQIALAQAIQSYQAAMQGGALGWSQVEILLQTGYEQHQQSRLAPYFLMYKAEAQIKQGKLDDAIATVEGAVAGLSKGSPLTNLYKTKLALMKVDRADEAGRQTALEQLKALAYDKENLSNDYAMYYLGLFVAHQGNKEEAHKIWKELVESQRHEQRLAQSPWVALAKEKLAQGGELLSA